MNKIYGYDGNIYETTIGNIDIQNAMIKKCFSDTIRELRKSEFGLLQETMSKLLHLRSYSDYLNEKILKTNLIEY